MILLLASLFACSEKEAENPTPEQPKQSELVVAASNCGKDMKKYAQRVEKLKETKDANHAPKAQQSFYKMKGQLDNGNIKEECKSIHTKIDKKYVSVMEEIGQSPQTAGKDLADQKAAEEEAKNVENESCNDMCKRTMKNKSPAAKLSCYNKCKKERGEQ